MKGLAAVAFPRSSNMGDPRSCPRPTLISPPNHSQTHTLSPSLSAHAQPVLVDRRQSWVPCCFIITPCSSLRSTYQDTRAKASTYCTQYAGSCEVTPPLAPLSFFPGFFPSSAEADEIPPPMTNHHNTAHGRETMLLRHIFVGQNEASGSPDL